MLAAEEEGQCSSEFRNLSSELLTAVSYINTAALSVKKRGSEVTNSELID